MQGCISRGVCAGSGATDDLRLDVAVAHRLMARYNMDELVWNHVSARLLASHSTSSQPLRWSKKTILNIPPLLARTAPKATDFLITSGEQMWGSMLPEDIVSDSDNETANVLHAGIFEVRHA